MNKRIVRLALGTAMAAIFAASAASVARADGAGECHRRLEHAKAKIDRDAARYGDHSRQVDRDVAKLEEQRQWCRDHHADWDHNAFDFGIYIRH